MSIARTGESNMMSKKIILLAPLASASLSGNMALAQDAASGNASAVLTEVIVTAEKRSEKLSDVPLSISAATGDQLAAVGINDPAGLEKIVPGFIYTKSAYSSPIYTIRGVGSYDEAIGISPAVGVYVDQVPLPFSRMTEGASFDLQRVEVLKGPQGTLFGENSTGGAVNYIANKPTNTPTGGTEFTYGSFNETDAQGFISGPISDSVTGRLAVRTEQRGDWQKSYTDNESLGQRHFSTARALLDYQPSADVKFELNINGWYDTSDTQAKQKIGYAPISPGGYAGVPGNPNFQAELQAFPNAPNDARAADWAPGLNYQRNDNFVQTSLHGDWNASDNVVLTSITAYSHLNVDTPNGNDGTTLLNAYSIIEGSIASFSQEIRASGQAGPNDQLKWMTGGNYEYDDIGDEQKLTVNATNTGIGPYRWNGINVISDQIVNTEALFGSLDYAVLDNLTVQGSARYTQADRTHHGCIADNGNGQLAAAFSFLSTTLSGSPTTIPAGGCVTLSSVTNKPIGDQIHNSLNENNVSWRTGLSWKVWPEVLLYANATKGYKSGTFGTIGDIRPAQDVPVKQESVLAYETGFKAAAFQRTVEVTGAAFYYDYQRKQLLGSINLGPPFGTLPGLVSIPRSRIDGAELDVTAKPIQGLTLRTGATYVYSEVRGTYFLANPLGGPAVNVGGDSFPNTPKQQFNGDAEYEHPIAGISGDWAGFAGAGATYRSSTLSFFGGNYDFKLPAYGLLDVRTGMENRTWRIELWGHNVTNRFYPTFATRVQDTITRTTGLPATYGVTVSANF